MSVDPPPEPSTAQRKLAAKRFNEHVKLFANTTTAIGLGILAAATIIPTFGPSVAGSPAVAQSWWTGPSAFFVLFCAALISHRFLRSEE